MAKPEREKVRDAEQQAIRHVESIDNEVTEAFQDISYLERDINDLVFKKSEFLRSRLRRIRALCSNLRGYFNDGK